MILIEIAGFLGADAEERFTATGKKVISLRVATKVRQGGKDETVWWKVSIWGDRFDKMLPYLKKGTAVIIVGEMGKPETYVDKEGHTQVSLTLSAEIIKFSPFGKPERPQETATSFSSNSMHQDSSYSGSEELVTHGAGMHDSFAGDDLPF